ncbi:hypothetical protein B0T10DRAFT_80898 [Thelonectria olida]|uniref:Secreted protein n=1 Tax=Thelonectria olida TaxID=1576542 RepID=A0A9P8W2X2_9HYPO|nr:hypothetical protein B0T10DRAFT_80898 [Thelonectria olida]
MEKNAVRKFFVFNIVCLTLAKPLPTLRVGEAGAISSRNKFRPRLCCHNLESPCQVTSSDSGEVLSHSRGR